MWVSAVLEAFGIELAGTVAGVLSAIVPAVVGWFLAKLLRSQHTDTKEGQAAIEARLEQAEAIIRGDLANGVKAGIDRIEAKVDAQDVAAEGKP